MIKCRILTKANGPPFRSPVFQQPQVMLIDGEWKAFGGNTFCSTVEEWDCTSLNLENNLESQLPQQIVTIKFPRLTKLFLNKNRIQSVQLLCRINFEQLEVLDLSQNVITSIKPLAKVVLIQLSRLHLEANCIRDNKFEANKILCPKLQTFSSDYFCFQSPQFQDISYLAKFETTKATDFYIDSCQRIAQKSVIVAIRAKLPEVQIAEDLSIFTKEEQPERWDFSDCLNLEYDASEIDQQSPTHGL